MSNSPDKTLEDEKIQLDDKISDVPQRTEPSEGWETMAQAWVSAFPGPKAIVSVTEVETWIGSNFHTLPADLRIMPRSELIDRLLSIQHYMRPTPAPAPAITLTPTPELTSTPTSTPAPTPIPASTPTPSHHNELKLEENQENQHPARFKRSDQWLPVYSWLESLDNGEVVKSKDISDWLEANPEVKIELSARHSRYHLTHYVKKCHVKILKRKEKKGLIRLSKATAMEVHKELGEKHPGPVMLSADPMSNIPKDSDLYRTKEKEAKRRFDILVELEKRLAPHFSKPRISN